MEKRLMEKIKNSKKGILKYSGGCYVMCERGLVDESRDVIGTQDQKKGQP